MNDHPVALITGGAKRIGAALCKALHQQGYNIILHYRSSQSVAKALQSSLNQIRKDSVELYSCDLSDHEQLSALAEFAESRWNRLDLLINNASVFQPDPDAVATNPKTFEHWQQHFDTNVKANYFLSQLLVRSLSTHNGNIINLIDIYAERPLRQHTIYSTSKAAGAMLTKSMAVEFAPHIRVNGISPGAILWPELGPDFGPELRPDLETDLEPDSGPDLGPDLKPELEESSDSSAEPDQDYKNDLLAKIPLKRLGSTDDIVKTALFLIDCDYINGQIIAIDGGRSLTI